MVSSTSNNLMRQAMDLRQGPDARLARMAQPDVGDGLRLDSVRRAGNGQAQLKRVAEEMESLFVKMMMGAMKKTVHQEEGLLYGGQAEEVFDDMLTEERSRRMAQTHSMGLADLIVKTYSKHVEGTRG